MLNKVLDFLGEHPLIAIILFLLMFSGGCSIAFHLGIVSSSTKLMPY